MMDVVVVLVVVDVVVMMVVVTMVTHKENDVVRNSNFKNLLSVIGFH